MTFSEVGIEKWLKNTFNLCLSSVINSCQIWTFQYTARLDFKESLEKDMLHES